MRYKDIVKTFVEDDLSMEVLTDKTSEFVEIVRDKHPEAVEAFLNNLKKDFYYLTDEEAKKVVDNLKNESSEHPMGEKWDKTTALKAFKDEGHPTSSDRYSENGVYYAMNMVYSDYFPMYKDDVEKYVEHAYLFLNDKDYSGKYAKEKWYACQK